MPPRAAKKATAGPGTKRAGRGRGTPKAQRQPEAPVEQPVEDEQVVEEVKEEVKVEEVVEEISLSVPDEKVAVAVPASDSKAEGKAEAKPEDKGFIPVEEEDEVKEDGDEYGKGGWLDLEDNDPEYEPEEYVDDEKDIEQDDIQEEGDDVEEVVGEGDMADEEMEGIHEELEGEEEDEHGQEEHADVDGTEEEEHHELFKERRKRKEFEVFVGGLDKDANEDDLRKVFSKVGEVTEVRLMMNPHTKKNKGFAFLRFATVEQAKRACTELKNPVVNGKQCGITPSQDNDTLFLGNICKTWTKEALKDKLKQYGVENIEDLTLVEDSNNEGMNRGFAFLEFSSRSDAMDAFKLLQKRDVVFGVDRPAKVSFADSFAEPGDEVMAQVKTVFVDGLPASWDEDRVRKILKKYGEIDKIELARNMPSAKRKDFGFVTFRTHDAAVTCAKIINNEELGEGETKAKVRARLSRPLQRGKGKHGARVNPRSGRLAPRGARVPWSRPAPRSLPLREARTVGRRLPPPADRGLKRPAGFRDRRPVMTMPARSRQAAPLSRSYDRRPIAPSYPKGGSRGYSRHEALPPRSRAPAGYGSKDAPDRRPLHKDDYYSRGYDYSDLPRGTSRTAARRPYVDDGYGQRFERPPPSYHEGRSRDYETISGSKRPYAAVDDLPPRYAEPGVRPSRSRLDYSVGGSASQYEDAYGDRLGRSSLGYGGGRSSASSQDPHGLYSSRHGMGYGEGSYGGGGGDGGSVYASSYGSSYASRGADVGGSSYSSLYSSRGLGGSSYMASGSSRSYY